MSVAPETVSAPDVSAPLICIVPQVIKPYFESAVRIGEIFQIADRPDQRWYWVPRLECDEVVLIKGWDSLDDGRAACTPHGAFALPEQDESTTPRANIETRAYAIYEPRS